MSSGLRELSLFTGAGGGVLGGRLLGWEAVGYVECNEYCQRQLGQRIADGYLPIAPIFCDVHEFLFSGAAEQYRGVADVVTGGFPCQDISAAGKGAGIDGEKSSLWFAMAAILRVVRPRFVLVENSPMLTVRGLGRILGSLAGLGFDAAWGVYAAADEGAPHLRRRLWIVGNANGDGESARAGDGGQVAGVPGVVTADANRAGLEKREGVAGNDGEEFPAALGGGWWESEPEVGRVAHGVADRVEQLRAIGNGQVPAVVVRAWRELSAAVMATDEEATT
jgi:DNA (cytosine-5)-methyltransferase 1